MTDATGNGNKPDKNSDKNSDNTDDIIHAIRRIMAAEQAILAEEQKQMPDAPPPRAFEADPALRAAAQERVMASINRMSGADEQAPTVLEALILERLDPLLQHWMDEHLPPLVERLLRAEMHRLILKALSLSERGGGDT